MKQKGNTNKGATVHVRAPSVDIRDQWAAAAAAEGRALSNWLAALATANSLPLKKDRKRT